MLRLYQRHLPLVAGPSAPRAAVAVEPASLDGERAAARSPPSRRDRAARKSPPRVPDARSGGRDLSTLRFVERRHASSRWDALCRALLSRWRAVPRIELRCARNLDERNHHAHDSRSPRHRSPLVRRMRKHGPSHHPGRRSRLRNSSSRRRRGSARQPGPGRVPALFAAACATANARPSSPPYWSYALLNALRNASF
jgi:hypothetical protein